MTQEGKLLLLKDLCTRLPYEVKVFYEYVDDLNKETYGYSLTLNTWCINELEAEKAVVKPYLRPLSSMTEEEIEELNCLCYHNIDIQDGRLCGYIYADEINDVLNYLNTRHFDYRGLIEKGLAIAVTEENNPYKE